ncbi:MAG: LemA family protein [Gammaproteobacteria bacterium]|nr:LemA family protein [Gammaproteobacteria bacterium]
MTPLMTILIVGAALALAAIVIFNRLVRDRNHVRAGWSDIDVQLQRRHDLIPQLVEAVRAYADYERATLTAVTELRLQSDQTKNLAQKARIEKQLSIGVDRLLAVAEDYPDLKANRSFLDLQKELSDTEDKLQYARRFYNGAVRSLNTRIESFPDLVIARMFGFTQAEFFDAEDEAASVPKVEMN